MKTAAPGTPAVLAALIVLQIMTAPLLAQAPSPTPNDPAAVEDRLRATPLRRGSELIGRTLKNNGGDEVGVLRDIIVDGRYGQLALAIVELNGKGEPGGKYHAVPFRAVREDAARLNLIFNLSEDELATTRGFEPDRWPDMSSEQWIAQIYKEHGYRPYWQARSDRANGTRTTDQADQADQAEQSDQPNRAELQNPQDGKAPAQPPRSDAQPPRDQQAPRANEKQAPRANENEKEEPRQAQPQPSADSKAIDEKQEADGEQQRTNDRPHLSRDHFWTHRVSQMLNKPVRGGQGDLGTLADVVIDMDGQLVYGIIARGGEGDQQRLAPVPWSALQVDGAKKQYALEAAPAALDAVAFERGKWPNMHEAYWARQVHEQFEQVPYWRVFGYPGGDDFDSHWRRGSAYNRLAEGSKPQTFTGTVRRIDTFTPAKGAGEGRLVILVTEDGQTHTIHLGPTSYLRDHADFVLKEGDRLQISGARAQFEGKDIVQARQVRAGGGQVLQLRDERGEPRWDQYRRDLRRELRREQASPDERGRDDRREQQRLDLIEKEREREKSQRDQPKRDPQQQLDERQDDRR